MSMPRSGVVTFRIAFAITLVSVMYLATIEQDHLSLERIDDKLSHFLAFGTLAFLGDFSFPEGTFGLRKFLWLLGYGLLIEVVQYFLPDRTPSLLDLSTDCVGIVAYWAMYRLLKYVPLLRERWT